MGESRGGGSHLLVSLEGDPHPNPARSQNFLWDTPQPKGPLVSSHL